MTTAIKVSSELRYRLKEQSRVMGSPSGRIWRFLRMPKTDGGVSTC